MLMFLDRRISIAVTDYIDKFLFDITGRKEGVNVTWTRNA